LLTHSIFSLVYAYDALRAHNVVQVSSVSSWTPTCFACGEPFHGCHDCGGQQQQHETLLLIAQLLLHLVFELCLLTWAAIEIWQTRIALDGLDIAGPCILRGNQWVSILEVEVLLHRTSASAKVEARLSAT